MKLRTYWSTEFACIFWPVSLTPPIDLIFPRNIFSHVCGLVCKFTAVRTHVIPLLKEREAARIWTKKRKCSQIFRFCSVEYLSWRHTSMSWFSSDDSALNGGVNRPIIDASDRNGGSGKWRRLGFCGIDEADWWQTHGDSTSLFPGLSILLGIFQ